MNEIGTVSALISRGSGKEVFGRVESEFGNHPVQKASQCVVHMC